MNRIRLDANRMMADMLGDKGISRAELADMAAKAKDAYAQVEANRGKGMQGWMDLPYNQGDVVERIEATAKRVAQEFEAFVVLGIGGSALGPLAVQQALNHLRYNELPAGKRPGPRLYVEDNIDPERMASLLDVELRAPASSTPQVQELHLPLYHALCACIEVSIFGE